MYRPGDGYVERIMAEAQVRRVPVVDRRGRCIGIIAQADLALNRQAASEREVAQVVESNFLNICSKMPLRPVIWRTFCNTASKILHLMHELLDTKHQPDYHAA